MRIHHLLTALLCAAATPGASAQDTPSIEPTRGAGPNAAGAVFPGAKGRPEGAETVITAREQATFDNRTGVAEFVGSVAVKDPQFTLSCDRLKAFLKEDRKGLERVEASGSVVIRQENKDEGGKTVVSTARAGKAVFYPATGDMELSDWPQITQGINSHVASEAETKMVLNRAGKINTTGGSKTVIADTGDAKP